MEAELAKRTAEEFDKRHGGNPILDENRCWLYFPDGCYRETNPLGARVEPKDPYRRAGFAVAYYQAKLELAIDEFTRFKRNLLSRTNAATKGTKAMPPPDQRAIQRLKDLQKKVNACSAELEEAREKMELVKPEAMKRQEQGDIELREEAQNVLGEIRSIEI